jgi:hypothetical protein
MVPRGFDLKVEGRHVFEEPHLHEIVRISADFRAVPRRTVEKASDGPYGLQEGRNAEVVERCRYRLFPI